MGLFSAERLAPLASVRGAHMVFVTALAFSADEDALLSVSADASARATPLPRPGGLSRLLYMLLVALAFLLCVVVGIVMSERVRSLAALLGLTSRGGHTEL